MSVDASDIRFQFHNAATHDNEFFAAYHNTQQCTEWHPLSTMTHNVVVSGLLRWGWWGL